MNTEKTEAILKANAALDAAGLPTYTELVGLIRAAARLGLQFDIGSAYIRRAYIDEQASLNGQIAALVFALDGTSAVQHGDLIQGSSKG